jgi:peptide chain release factor 2
MNNELIAQIQELQTKLQQTGEILNLNKKKTELEKLEKQMSIPNFWDNKEQAAQISQKAGDLTNEINEFNNLQNNLQDLLALAQENSDQKIIIDELKKLEKKYSELEFKTLLSEKYDSNNTLLSIYAGAGGTDAQDWAEMLERMFLRFCENKNWKINILDRQTGSEAGIKSVDLEIIENYSYGNLKSENGVHRLVRISPFDAEKMRHTSFALVQVLPELPETENIEINEKDLKIDTFKSGGHGGQSVNTTDSAVRIKHIPTDITVSCQNERSQLQNKSTALKILASKIEQYNQTEKEEERQKLRGQFTEAAWGNQIRSYVLHPYKQVKDHRTNFETQDVDKVLDGELDEFIQEYLKFIKK